MNTQDPDLNRPLTGLDFGAWLQSVRSIAGRTGQYQPLGPKHFATFVDAGKTLLVTFESVDEAMGQLTNSRPIGWDIVAANGWSHLGLFAVENPWFRDQHIYRFFDDLIDDHFFDDFDQVIFFGTGPCGYAACAYSVAAPGAQVLALSPQASLDQDTAPWDDRFPQAAQLDFTDRYGYAPDLLDAAESATIVFDPEIAFDARHAAMFTGPNVTTVRARQLGVNLRQAFLQMGIMGKAIEHLATKRLASLDVARLLRERKFYGVYQRTLLRRLGERPYLAARLCSYVLRQRNAPRFRDYLEHLKALEREGQITLPPET